MKSARSREPADRPDDREHRGADRRIARGPALLAAILTGTESPADLYSGEGARLYDRIAELDASERTELLAHLACTTGAILELACGGGRLTLPMLALGRPVAGIDLSLDLVELLRSRYDALPASRRKVPLAVDVADMRDFDLRRRFGAVVLASTSVFLLNEGDRRKLYDAVLRHLENGGHFIVTAHGAPLRPGATSSSVIPIDDTVAVLSDMVRSDGRTRDISLLRISQGANGYPQTSAFASTVFTVTEHELDAELLVAGFVRIRAIDTEPAIRGDRLRILVYQAQTSNP